MKIYIVLIVKNKTLIIDFYTELPIGTTRVSNEHVLRAKRLKKVNSYFPWYSMVNPIENKVE